MKAEGKPTEVFGPEETEEFYELSEADEAYETISDPLEPLNRVFFHFNDKLYFWFLKPVASGYRAVVPGPIRVCVSNFFDNLAFPVRFVSCLLQGKFQAAGDEFGCFIVNSTVGLAGFFDIAETHYKIKASDEDLGQTLGFYGMGPAFYINWPILGPSSMRDTIGTVGDAFLDPLGYMDLQTKYRIAVKGYDTVNDTSLTIGEYEDLKKAALDPYVSVRDAYFQYRRNKIEE
ncbi:MAG: VacJ family lipoprotein [Deltaproteobacteria bacterium]|nr:VacJ family lipoprotein [Deltaproteobacteria bacterium]